MNPAREARIAQVARAIEERTGNMRFVDPDASDASRPPTRCLIKADYELWARLAVRDGWTVTWVCEWIGNGHPTPPAWLWRWGGKQGTA